MAGKSAAGHRGNRLLAALPLAAFALLERDLKEISLAQGDVILEPGGGFDRVFFPQTGMISLLVVTKDGNSIETATIGREGAHGLQRGLGKRRSFTRAVTQIAGKFTTIRAERFEQFVRSNPAAQELIARYTEILWAEAQQIAACNAVHDASSRLCRWLLQSSDRIVSEVVPLTQEFMAQMLGVRRTTVTLLARELQEKGVIAYRRGVITIVDRKQLEACACECYAVIQQETLPPRLGVDL